MKTPDDDIIDAEIIVPEMYPGRPNDFGQAVERLLRQKARWRDIPDIPDVIGSVIADLHQYAEYYEYYKKLRKRREEMPDSEDEDGDGTCGGLSEIYPNWTPDDLLALADIIASEPAAPLTAEEVDFRRLLLEGLEGFHVEIRQSKPADTSIPSYDSKRKKKAEDREKMAELILTLNTGEIELPEESLEFVLYEDILNNLAKVVIDELENEYTKAKAIKRFYDVLVDYVSEQKKLSYNVFRPSPTGKKRVGTSVSVVGVTKGILGKIHDLLKNVFRRKN